MYDPRILAALRENYQNCTSYEDLGTVTTKMFSDDSIEERQCEFSTVYIRPDMVRFEIRDSDLRSVLQANGDSVRNLSYGEDQTLKSVTLLPSLSQALGALQGITHGIFPITFGLLNDLTSPNLYDTLSNLDRQNDEIIDGNECYRVFGEYRDLGTYTLWISKEKNILKCVEQTINENAVVKANLLAKPIIEAEGLEWTDIPPCSLKTIYNFEQITFNNGITIDAIG